MPRGRKIIGPPAAITAPRGRDDPDALIDAARQGWIRDAHAVAIGRASAIAGSRLRQPSTRKFESWIDAQNHPHDPQRRGRPHDHYLSLLVKAVVLLEREQEWTQYRARRYVADRLLSLLPGTLTVRVLCIPQHVLDGKSGDARHAAARKWIMNRLQQACRG